MTHVNNAFGAPYQGRGLAKFFSLTLNAGWVGVDLFFVLSGFLITGILLDERHAPGYFTNFYARRVLRIFPLYYGFLITFLYLLPALSSWAAQAFYVPPAAKTSLLLYYYNFYTATTRKPIGIFHIFWSLSIEEHFYLFWPMLVWLLKPATLKRCCLAIITLSLLCRLILIGQGSWMELPYLITPCRLDGLAAGAVAAIAMRDPLSWARFIRFCKPVLILSLATLILIAIHQGHFMESIDFRFAVYPLRRDSFLLVGPGLTVLAIFFTSLLVMLVAGQGGLLLRLTRWLPLRSIGKYSYGMYVFHVLMLEISLAIAWHIFGSPDHWNLQIGKPLLYIWTALLTYIAAWLSYHLFEKHFLSLKRFFKYGRQPRSPLF